MIIYLKQAAITLLFAGMLFAAWKLNSDAKREEDLGRELALKRFGFCFRECAKDCGIDFIHEGPQQLDERLEHIMPIIASMGASVSIVDYNKDGLLDIYVVTSREGGLNRLYRNNGDGTFRDVAGELGIADLNQPGTGVCQGAVWGDFDNDGFEDLFVYKWGKPELIRNMKGERFERITDQADLPRWVNASSAIWVDYDCDGLLDLFVAGYWPDEVNLWKLSSTRMMPESFEYAKNGGRKYLLKNLGNGKFRDVTEEAGIRSTRWTLGVAAADLCGTGYPDIVLANDYGNSEFLCNKGGKKFEEVGEQTGIGVAPKSGMNATFGDLFNSGKLAIYISNITEPGNLVQGNNLWVPTAHEPGQLPRYINRAGDLKVELGGWSWGAQFGDFSNAGRLDLYLTNGYISTSHPESYWYDYSLIAGGNTIVIGDAKNWPAMKGRSLAGSQSKCVWWNRDGEFVDVAKAVGVTDTNDGRAVALADLFNRGMLDVVVANQNGPLLLYKNTVVPGRDWVQVELEGTKSNRSAIGAMVHVYWRNPKEGRAEQQVQVVSGGNGYASQNMRRLHFGLGAEAEIDRIEIHWPSGAKSVQIIEAPRTNMIHRIRESVP